MILKSGMDRKPGRKIVKKLLPCEEVSIDVVCGADVFKNTRLSEPFRLLFERILRRRSNSSDIFFLTHLERHVFLGKSFECNRVRKSS